MHRAEQQTTPARGRAVDVFTSADDDSPSDGQLRLFPTRRQSRSVIALYTDFGLDDPYVGQMKAVLLRQTGGSIAIVDLLHRVPNFDPVAGAHLLSALQAQFDPGTVFVAVVDPGVGSERLPVVLEADGKYYVGPDNGLLAVVAARALRCRAWRITWRPSRLSASFHGRDLFAPIAARIAIGDWPADDLADCACLTERLSGNDLPQIIYLDHYGNAMTGWRAANVAPDATIATPSEHIASARVFSAVPIGQVFWYENSLGLVEIAVNRGHAAARLNLVVGAPVALLA